MKIAFAVALRLMLSALLGLTGAVLSDGVRADLYVASRQFGAPAGGHFNVPSGVAIEPGNRNIVVVDGANARVQIFDSAGNTLGQFGEAGLGNGQFQNPQGIAIDPTTGNIAVGDSLLVGTGASNRVQVFSASGAYLSQLTLQCPVPSECTLGSLNLDNITIPAIAIDGATHNILVMANVTPGSQFSPPAFSAIEIFSAAGGYLREIGSFGAANGQFKAPSGMAIDAASGNVVVADTGNQRVQIFNAAGTFLSAFGTPGAGNGQFADPTGLAIDPLSHDIVVADGQNHRVQIFSATGTYMSQFAILPDAGFALGITIDPSSRSIIVAESSANRVQVFDPTGVPLYQFGSTGGTGNGELGAPKGIAVDAHSGNVAVVDTANDLVQVFDPSGAFLSQFGGPGTGNGQFSFDQQSYRLNPPVAIDPGSSNMVVEDPSNSRVEVFDASGRYLSQFGGAGTGNGQFTSMGGLAIDSTSHNILVGDTISAGPQGHARIQVFSSSGSYLGQIVSSSGLNVSAFAVDPTRQHIATEGGIYDYSGTLIGSYHTGTTTAASAPPVCPSPFDYIGIAQYPDALAIDPGTGNIALALPGYLCVQTFDATGAFLGQFGTFIDYNTQLFIPTGVAFDPSTHNLLFTDPTYKVELLSPVTSTLASVIEFYDQQDDI